MVSFNIIAATLADCYIRYLGPVEHTEKINAAIAKASKLPNIIAATES